MDAFIEYDTDRRKDLSVVLRKKEEGTNDNRNGRGKKDRCKVEIQRGKEAEKCSVVPVDRHALKKITVSFWNPQGGRTHRGTGQERYSWESKKLYK